MEEHKKWYEQTWVKISGAIALIAGIVQILSDGPTVIDKFFGKSVEWKTLFNDVSIGSTKDFIEQKFGKPSRLDSIDSKPYYTWDVENLEVQVSFKNGVATDIFFRSEEGGLDIPPQLFNQVYLNKGEKVPRKLTMGTLSQIGDILTGWTTISQMPGASIMVSVYSDEARPWKETEQYFVSCEKPIFCKISEINNESPSLLYVRKTPVTNSDTLYIDDREWFYLNEEFIKMQCEEI